MLTSFSLLDVGIGYYTLYGKIYYNNEPTRNKKLYVYHVYGEKDELDNRTIIQTDSLGNYKYVVQFIAPCMFPANDCPKLTREECLIQEIEKLNAHSIAFTFQQKMYKIPTQIREVILQKKYRDTLKLHKDIYF